MTAPTNETEASSELIAIVGMACRVPGASNPDDFWNLSAKTGSGMRPTGRRNTKDGWVDVVGMLDHYRDFDREFFRVSEREATLMDPQQRHFLELVWEAIEDAGIDPDHFDGDVGVFAGCGQNTYLINHVLTNPDVLDNVGWFLLRHLGNDKDFLATMASYKLNLTGPSMSIQTACSTSLVAIHTAAQSLLNYECDAAVAGGITIDPTQNLGYEYREGEILSPDGECRPFDREAGGTVLTSGGGAVILRRYDDALRDGTRVHALIRASAVNNDGQNKISYLAPSVDGQAAAIGQALALADIEPSTIGYVETHGTGTAVGDPIEVEALRLAYDRPGTPVGTTHLGSAKANVGHLDTAAGVVGLIRAVQAIKHQTIPPLRGYTETNPLIELDGTPFALSNKSVEWTESAEHPRRAGVSSLGVGGTNAHVIIEEAPERAAPDSAARLWQLMPVSGRTASAASAAAGRLAGQIRQNPEDEIADVAHTLQTRRHGFEYRVASVGRDPLELSESLLARSQRQQAATKVIDGTTAFLFPGGGAARPGMGSQLYRSEPAFREVIDRGIAHLKGRVDVETLLLGSARDSDMEVMANGLPCLALIETALAHLWQAYGVVPSALLGHSLGEYVAAHIAGVFTFEDMLDIVLLRGELMDRAAGHGEMLSVAAPAADVEALLPSNAWVAVINAEDQTAVSGTSKAIAELRTILNEREVLHRRVQIAAAPHSPLLDDVIPDFRAGIERVALAAPQIAVASNVTGQWHTSETITDPEYWVQHLRQAVRYNDCMETLVGADHCRLIEVGPGQALTGLASGHVGAKCVATLAYRDGETDEDRQLMAAIAAHWEFGGVVDWSALHNNEARKHVDLPSYPFDHESYWLEPGEGSTSRPTHQPGPPKLRRSAESEWLRQRRWVPRHQQTYPEAGGICWVIASGTPFDDFVIEELKRLGQAAALLQLPTEHRIVGVGAYRGAIESFSRQTGPPRRIVDLRLLDSPTSPASGTALAAEAERGLFNVASLAEALAETWPGSSIALDIVTDRALAPADVTFPEYGMIAGAATVLATEFAGVDCRVVDIDTEAYSHPETLIAAEVLASERLTAVSWRDGMWLTNVWDAPDVGGGNPFADGDRVVIFGAYGGVGAALAQQLAATYDVDLTLASRRSATDPSAAKLVAQLEAAGATVTTAVVDIEDAASVAEVLDATAKRAGGVDVIMHLAGILEDSLWALKDTADAHRVLGPKVIGARNIADAIATGPAEPKLVLLSSSVSAEAGLPGQVDYAAANSYLDLLGESLGVPFLAVEWGTWQQVGMAQLAIEPETPLLGEPVTHPILRRYGAADDVVEFRGSLRAPHHWLTTEHVIRDRGVVPGTALVDLALTTLPLANGAPATLDELVLVRPIIASDEGLTDVRVCWTPSGAHGLELAISTRSERQVHWTDVAYGSVCDARVFADTPDAVAVTTTTPAHDPLAAQRRHVTFGRHWDNLQAFESTETEARATVRLDAPTPADEGFTVHPALLDVVVATGVSLLGDDHDGLWVPTVVRKMSSAGQLGLHLDTSVSLLTSENDRATLSAIVRDADSDAWLRIDHLEMRLLADPDQLLAATPAPGRDAPLSQQLLAFGLRPEEAWRQLTQAITHVGSGTVRIAPVPGDLIRAVTAAPAAKPKTTPAPGHAAETPRDQFEVFVADAWASLLGLETIDVRAELADLGANSLLAIRFVNLVRKNLELRVELADLTAAGTVEEAAAVLRRLSTPEPAAPGGDEVSADAVLDLAAYQSSDFVSLVPIKPSGTRTPIFMIHGAGGGGLIFRKLAQAFPEDQPVYALQARGIREGMEPDTDIGEMARFYHEEIRRVHPDGKLLLYGWSGGGVIAYEIAQMVGQDNIGLLCFVDTFCPSLRGRTKIVARRLTANPAYGKRLARAAKATVKAVVRAKVPGLSTNEELEVEQAADASPAQIDATALEERMWDATRIALWNYKVKPYDGDVVLLRSAEGELPELGITEVEDLGWSSYVRGRFEVLTSTGNHVSMLLGDNAAVLAGLMSSLAIRAQAASTTAED